VTLKLWVGGRSGHKINNIAHYTGGKIEAPKVSTRMGCGEGVGAVPPPQKFFGFLISKW